MKATQSLEVDLDELEGQGEDANLVIRLMRAGDDISLANLCLGYFRGGAGVAEHTQTGACRYFIRLQCGHLAEAMRLIEEFATRPKLVELLTRCTPSAQAAFNRASECVRGGVRRDEFEVAILSIRNRLAFHYDRSLFAKALKRRPGRRSRITRGTDISLWRYGVADDLEDTIVCRLLWKIPPSEDLRKEADKRAKFGSDLCQDFLTFVGEFSFLYIENYAEA